MKSHFYFTSKKIPLKKLYIFILIYIYESMSSVFPFTSGGGKTVPPWRGCPQPWPCLSGRTQPRQQLRWLPAAGPLRLSAFAADALVPPAVLPFASFGVPIYFIMYIKPFGGESIITKR